MGLRTDYPVRALVMIALVVVTGSVLSGCKKKKVQPFSCEQYQKRMGRCEHYVVAALKRRFDVEVKTGKLEADDAFTQFKKVQWRIRRRIRYKNTQRHCEKLQRLQTPHHRKRFTTMKYCYQRSGCEGFAVCVLGLW
jgi:hypothetical protein